MIGAMAAHARGAVDLADGDAARRARRAAAGERTRGGSSRRRTRRRGRACSSACACRALGDDDTAALELDAARDGVRASSARRRTSRGSTRSPRAPAGDAHGLTPRELEVLRLVAAGRSNREIAAALVISEHTVARHLQNIFAKLGVSSRTAASAFAFAHDLL